MTGLEELLGVDLLYTDIERAEARMLKAHAQNGTDYYSLTEALDGKNPREIMNELAERRNKAREAREQAK